MYSFKQPLLIVHSIKLEHNVIFYTRICHFQKFIYLLVFTSLQPTFDSVYFLCSSSTYSLFGPVLKNDCHRFTRRIFLNFLKIFVFESVDIQYTLYACVLHLHSLLFFFNWLTLTLPTFPLAVILNVFHWVLEIGSYSFLLKVCHM